MLAVPGSVPCSIPVRLATRPDSFHRLLTRHGVLQKPAAINSQNRRIGCRCIGSQSARNVAGSPYACTWLTTAPEEITLDDILSSAPASKLDPGYVPVVLVTPAFAPWIDPNHPFLPQWINRVYRPTRSDPFRAIVAIVDRLPEIPRQSTDVVDNGPTTDYDGISVLLARAGNVRGKGVSRGSIRAGGITQAALVFSVQPQNAQIPTMMSSGHIHEVGLRLANTIFVNGKESTLLLNQWTASPDSTELTLEHSVDLSACMVTLTPVDTRGALHLPLHPVGQRRRVLSSMGNILRQIGKHADERSDEPMPASSELEKELPRYITEHNISGQRVSVWALVEPFQETSCATPGHYSRDDIQRSLEMGAKLHRVMSGGGGWGKKQGLLSLDPETSFAQADNENLLTLDQVVSPDPVHSHGTTTFPFEEELILEDLSTLSQVARRGDYVQFFASVEPSSTPSDTHPLPYAHEGDIVCRFGVVSDVEIPLNPATGPKNLIISPNSFGALSEKAVTYMQPVRGAERKENLKSRTKIDVPDFRVDLILE